MKFNRKKKAVNHFVDKKFQRLGTNNKIQIKGKQRKSDQVKLTRRQKRKMKVKGKVSFFISKKKKQNPK